ncbi:MAG: BON domain-containing protein [Burkholderiaceae bacterium]
MIPTALLRCPRGFGLTGVAVLASLALTGCNPSNTATASSASDPQAVSAGTALDDSVITTKVKAALLTGTNGKGADTGVETRKGEVLLSGFVDDQAQADRESQLARGVEGVKSVDNKLMVKAGRSTAGNVLDDSVVTVKVKSALMADTQTKASDIAVSTNKGVVQLSGFVDSTSQQARAASVARTVEGVQSVVNDTSIKQ